MPDKIFANAIIPAPMRDLLDGITKVADKIRTTLTRYDITTIQGPLKADIDTLHQLVVELDAAFEASRDTPNGQWVTPGSAAKIRVDQIETNAEAYWLLVPV